METSKSTVELRIKISLSLSEEKKMEDLIILLVIGTSIWVFFDAKSIGVKKGMVEGIANMNPWGWLFGCLLLWIITFPIYLAKRPDFKRIAQST